MEINWLFHITVESQAWGYKKRMTELLYFGCCDKQKDENHLGVQTGLSGSQKPWQVPEAGTRMLCGKETWHTGLKEPGLVPGASVNA